MVGAISQSNTEMVQAEDNVQMSVTIHGYAQTCSILISAQLDGHAIRRLVLAIKMPMERVMQVMKPAQKLVLLTSHHITNVIPPLDNVTNVLKARLPIARKIVSKNADPVNQDFNSNAIERTLRTQNVSNAQKVNQDAGNNQRPVDLVILSTSFTSVTKIS